MLSYNLKYQDINNRTQKHQLVFYNPSDIQKGQIHKSSVCWKCSNPLQGFIQESPTNKKRYTMKITCEHCKINKQITVAKYTVHNHDTIVETQQEQTTQQPITSQQKSNAVTASDLYKKYKKSKYEKPDNKQITSQRKTSNEKSVKHTSSKYISYKNRLLFHQPILGDQSSGKLVKQCCSNKCPKCRGRLQGRATKLDDSQVMLFWKCEKCKDRNEVTVNYSDLD